MDKWEKILQDFSGCSERLERAVGTLSPEDLDRVPKGGSWTPRQIVHHLADGACIWGMFIHQAMAGKGGEFNLHWYWDIPQDEWARIWNYESREIGPSLETYRANQTRLLALLEKEGSSKDLTLEIRIQDNPAEDVSIMDAVRIQILHLKEHLGEINRILKE